MHREPVAIVLPSTVAGVVPSTVAVVLPSTVAGVVPADCYRATVAVALPAATEYFNCCITCCYRVLQLLYCLADCAAVSVRAYVCLYVCAFACVCVCVCLCAQEETVDLLCPAGKRLQARALRCRLHGRMHVRTRGRELGRLRGNGGGACPVYPGITLVYPVYPGISGPRRRQQHKLRMSNTFCTEFAHCCVCVCVCARARQRTNVPTHA